MQCETLVIGGGLSGLKTAVDLNAAGRDVVLVEARDRLGGRILSLSLPEDGVSRAQFDFGPSWFWPGQARMARLVGDLGLAAFLQHDQGAQLFEAEDGVPRQTFAGAGMSDSYRLQEGLGGLVAGLARRLPAERLWLDSRVRRIARTESGVESQVLRSGETITVSSARAVIALPPRLLAQSIAFAPVLESLLASRLHSLPTWMAGHAKVVALYERPFWREQGLSGDAISHRGPLAEIHDASPASGGPYALFGFVGTPAHSRRGRKPALLDASRAQLVRLFGDAAADPLALRLHDWAEEPLTATAADQQPPNHLPAYGLPSESESLWEGRILLSGSETARQYGGFLEGALEASDRVLAWLA